MKTNVILEIVQKDFPTVVSSIDQGNYVDFISEKGNLVVSLSKSTLRAMLMESISEIGENYLD